MIIRMLKTHSDNTGLVLNREEYYDIYDEPLLNKLRGEQGAGQCFEEIANVPPNKKVEVIGKKPPINSGEGLQAVAPAIRGDGTVLPLSARVGDGTLQPVVQGTVEGCEANQRDQLGFGAAPAMNSNEPGDTSLQAPHNENGSTPVRVSGPVKTADKPYDDMNCGDKSKQADWDDNEDCKPLALDADHNEEVPEPVSKKADKPKTPPVKPKG